MAREHVESNRQIFETLTTLNSRRGRDGSHSLHHCCIPDTVCDSVNTPLRINGVTKVVKFLFRGFRWVRRHIRGEKEHKSPLSNQIRIFFWSEKLWVRPNLRVHLTPSRLKFRFLSPLSSPFGSVLSRPEKFIDAGLKLVIGFASRNGEDLFLEFVPLENHLLSSFPVRSNSISSNDLTTSRWSLPFRRLTIVMSGTRLQAANEKMCIRRDLARWRYLQRARGL